jgi:HK97 family phage major capsid protein
MSVDEKAAKQLAEILTPILIERHGVCTLTMLDKAVADIQKRTAARQAKGNNFSLSRVIRALRVVSGQTALNENTKDSDLAYLNQTCERAMSTGTPPGSYLVPTIQADTIIEYLNLGGVARAAGVRIWPMKDIQKMTIPTALAAPTWTWAVQWRNWSWVYTGSTESAWPRLSKRARFSSVDSGSCSTRPWRRPKRSTPLT